MGVTGLQTYLLKTCPWVKEKVSIQKMVEEFKQRNADISHPEIVCTSIVAYDIYYNIYDQLDHICGGQFLEFYSRLQFFIKLFNDLDIKLVFCFHDVIPELKNDHWLDSCRQKIESVRETFSAVKQCRALPSNGFQATTLRTFLKCALANLSATHNVSVLTTAAFECVQAVAKYAKDNNCMAIMTEDSDFIVYDTVPYLSVRELNIEKLETIQYNREKICQAFGITLNELPVFASLYNNDLMTREMLKPFHDYLYKNFAVTGRRRQGFVPEYINKFILIPAINKFISLSRHGDLLKASASALQSHCRNETIVKTFYVSIDMYKLDIPGDLMEDQSNAEIQQVMPVTHQDLCSFFQKFSNSFIYESLVGKMSAITISLEDFTNDLYPTCRILYQPIRQRLYGIVMKNGIVDNPSDEINERWIDPDAGLKQEVIPVSLININGRIATLRQLWFPEEEENAEHKLDVFAQCMGLSLLKEALQQMSPSHVLLVVVVNYLISNPEMKLELWEIEALIVQAVHPQGQDESWLQTLSFDRYDSNAVHLATIVTQGFVIALDALFVCNYLFKMQDFMMHKCFDGKRFHYCYQTMKKLYEEDIDLMDFTGNIKNHHGLLNNDEDAITAYSHLKEIALDGIDMSCLLDK